MSIQESRTSITNSDPLTYLLISRWRWPIWLPITVLLAWSAIGLFLLSWLLGYLYGHSGLLGTFDVPSESAIAFIFQPTMLYYHLAFPQMVTRMLNALLRNGVIPNENRKEFNQLTSKIATRYNARIAFLLSLGFSITVTLIMIFLAQNLQLGYPFWLHSIYWAFIMFQAPQIFLTAYSIAYIVIRILILHAELSNFLHVVEIHVQPLHPDGAGGLTPLGNLVGSYMYWILAAFIFVTQSGWAAYFQFRQFPAYVIAQFIFLPVFVLASFLVPLRSSHLAMQRAKSKLLERFNIRFTNNVQPSNIVTNSTLSVESRNLIDLVEASNKIREIFPVWPYNTSIFQRVLLTILASLLPLVFSLLEQYIIRLLP